ncbi:hypothetical protein BFT35_12755 [Thermoanaerobacterium thermosaccharolyticum]|uniref:Peptidase M23 n=1 Tax=Thermoanaerobacterium thermosaccharolyticum TaxID=1517 RepID=A0A223HYD0_THETR|nr:helix-turn-helix domain-containing protein [Thermoanaerobacterium thermosaccharolyticum]AST57486.1 peptidase M23 [Thermoanaerobacterium thermosaccharolyticum]PHO06143.1 hypothetical protein BFT35_12755 [Thermoanaerobacterium thermosaccharolyticum]
MDEIRRSKNTDISEMAKTTYIRRFEKYYIKEEDSFSLKLPFIEGELMPLKFDLLTYDYNTDESKLVFPKGRYVVPIEGSKNIEYRPLIDFPDLFFAFSNLGRNSEVNEEEIIKFIKTYGGNLVESIKLKYLKRVSDKIASVDLDIPINKYNIEDIYKYAREAFFVFQLYDQLKSKNIKKLRNTLIDFYEFVDKIIHTNSELSSIPYATTFRNGFVKYIQYIVDEWEEIMKKFDINKSIFIESVKSGNKEMINFMLTELMTDYMVIELATNLINVVIAFRTANINIRIDFEGVMMESESKIDFIPSWGYTDLIQAIWLHFWLIVTKQIKIRYTYCEFCGLPILNPRKNQRFHPGCRQAWFNQQKRNAIKMYKEGLNIEEIAIKLNRDVEQIKEWVKKET